MDTIPVIPKHSDNLALLGDIGNPFEESYTVFMRQVSLNFQKVFVILGNHEYYGNVDMHLVIQKVKKILEQFSNCYLLDRGTYNLTDNTVLLGCTLWSNIEETTFTLMNCNGNIKDFDIDTMLTLHFIDRNWILEYLKSTDKKVVILTHYASHSRMNGDYAKSDFTSAFLTDIREFHCRNVIANASGHVHSNVDFYQDGTRYISNCMGYQDEGNVKYDSHKVIVLP